MKRVIFYSCLTIALFIACEGPAGPPGEDGEDGAWQIIDVITLATDTNIITFDGIVRDKWELMEIQATGSFTPDSGEGSTFYATTINMRFNNDSDSSYFQFASRRDFIGVSSWFNHYFVFNATIIPYCQSDSVFSVNWNLYGYYPEVGGGSIDYRSALYFNPIDEFIDRIDLYIDEIDSLQSFKAGCEFILLGLDID